MLIRAVLAAVAVLVSACATQLPPLAEATPTPYTLGPGDEIRIDIYRLAEVTNTYVVSDTGMLSLPLLGQFPAGGKTIDALEGEIRKAVAAANIVHEPSVSAQVIKYRPFFVIGEVQKPGQYPYVPNMSVLTALSVAGGATFRANTDKVVITRRIDGVTTEGKAGPDSLVLPGDIIKVKEGWF